jgi:proline dehydrogenase
MLDGVRNYVVSRIASRHVAGEDLKDALVVCEWAKSRGYNFVLSPWKNGELSDLNETDKKQNAESFLNAIDAVQRFQGRGYLSMKLDAIDYDFDLFIQLLDAAKSADVRVHIDSLGPDTADINFEFLERASKYRDNLGCTLPSRWKRSLTDAEKAIDLGLAVRLVKGQWQDPDHEINHRQNYLNIAQKLAGNVPYVGVATHDKSLAKKVLKILKRYSNSFELEQFFSLPLNGIQLAEEMGCQLRIYTSYGFPAIPYNYRFALTRPELGAWMVTDFAFRFKKPWENSY